jgi:hypothetical protein
MATRTSIARDADAAAPQGNRNQTTVSSHNIFDDIARTLGSGMPRRQAFALAVKGLAGAALAEFGVWSAWAQSTCLCQGQTYNPQTACCTPSGVQAKHPITNLAACPNKVKHPGYVGRSNGCGPEGGAITPFVPNRFGLANFGPCCDAHDFCYGDCNASKSGCDNTFGVCNATACAVYAIFQVLLPSCLTAAAAYFAAVSLGGGDAYEAAQQGGCDCCGTSTCPQSCAGSSCGSLPACAGGADCVCFTSTEGTGACVHGATPCSAVQTCRTTADCPAGTACLTTSCCGSQGVCGPLCNPVGPAGGAAKSTAARAAVQANVRTLGGM